MILVVLFILLVITLTRLSTVLLWLVNLRHPSVHIPSIIPSQSLLLSRDEVFKEIKDVAISSFHLFQGDMDLPPFSLHSSLEVKPEKLPPHCACDHHVELEGLLPPVGVIYSLSKNESETLWAYISENVEKGFIRPRYSSTGAPVFFVKKKDGGLGLCVEYRKLNAVTRKNRYPVPPIDQLLTVFNGATIFSKIDLHGAYNLLRIKEGDEHLTAFRTKYGSYEYLVMPFGLTNAPASFQNLVNDIFADFLDIFAVVYLDDIMVFSSSQEEHVKQVSSVLQSLREDNLFAKASKCVFHASSVEYLGYVVSSEGLKMDSCKVQKILNWPQPKNIKALQSFLEFANFYPCFIKNYSKKSLLSLPSLENILLSSSMRKLLVNYSGEHPIAFDSRKLLPAEINYEIQDKELLGIVWALKHWRAFLLSLSASFEVLTDHSSLQYLMSSKFLSFCQACWAEFLSELHFSITYGPGRLATLPDALSCWDNVYPERGVDFISKSPQKFHQVLKKNEIKESRFFSINVEVFSDLVDQIQKAVWQDKHYKDILKQLARGESVSDYTLEPQSKLLLFKCRVVIPSNHELQLDILQKRHDSPSAGHPGQEKTLKLIKRDFYWAGMNQIINNYMFKKQENSS
ncbi:hypothetical protein O181_092796 [Austropuccinia psidii MF-1]|uniref:Reverse transcriptase domain-containing protein n=1 Tax=Austropuccinia psidii MF-1 TaxID=1389203 RepID=A0A9Q3J089_9BASI|nr:hypothetical protein [Austropuccinia psidii MF-1]